MDKESDSHSVDTVGGAAIGQGVDTGGGNFVGRDAISGNNPSIFHVQGDLYINAGDTPVEVQPKSSAEAEKQAIPTFNRIGAGDRSTPGGVPPIILAAIIIVGAVFVVITAVQDKYRANPAVNATPQLIRAVGNVQEVAVNEGESKQVFFNQSVVSLHVEKKRNWSNSDYYGTASNVTIVTQRENQFVTLKPGDCIAIDLYTINLVDLEPKMPHTATFLVTRLAPEAKAETCSIKPTATSQYPPENR